MLEACSSWKVFLEMGRVGGEMLSDELRVFEGRRESSNVTFLHSTRGFKGHAFPVKPTSLSNSLTK